MSRLSTSPVTAAVVTLCLAACRPAGTAGEHRQPCECQRAAPRAGSASPAAKTPRRGLRNPETLAALRAANIDPTKIRCNERVVWVPGLSRSAQRAADEIAELWRAKPSPALRRRAGRVVLGHMVRLVFQNLGTQNFGAIRLKGHSYQDSAGHEQPLLVFRSGVTTDAAKPGSCFQSLLGPGRVRHVVNLYGGHFPLHDFIRAEKAVAHDRGVTHHDTSNSGRRWRRLIKRERDYEKNHRRAMEIVAELINGEILRPGGKAPRGNVYLHCGGGMHRSGMVFGILRRCINGDPIAQIEADYRRHTACTADDRPSGYEPLNMRFIREFDCTLLGAQTEG